MTTEKETKWKPFHESIVEALEQAYSEEEVRTLGRLISSTTIPRNHQAIVEAFEKKAREKGVEFWFLTSVISNLKEQEQVEAEKQKEREANDA